MVTATPSGVGFAGAHDLLWRAEDHSHVLPQRPAGDPTPLLPRSSAWEGKMGWVTCPYCERQVSVAAIEVHVILSHRRLRTRQRLHLQQALRDVAQVGGVKT